MDAAWLDALTQLWKNDEDFDFDALEAQYRLKPLERCGSMPVSLTGEPTPRQSLLICLTGFGDKREGIARRIEANGGEYTGDLTKRCTHLVVNQPEGKKFTAAKNWGIHAVTLSWLERSLERGMILEENKFDPLLPLEEQGVGAWIKQDPKRMSLGKRSRSAQIGVEEGGRGPRKLRKTASMKLASQRDGIFGDILKRSDSRDYSFGKNSDVPQARSDAPAREPKPPTEQQTDSPNEAQGIFSECNFSIYGFSKQRKAVLEQTITSLGGSVLGSLEALAWETPSKPRHRFLIVPQSSQPDTHPQQQPDNIHAVTEFYIEKCLHNKHLFDPTEHILGRPFPLFPINGMQDMTVCTAAFTGIELSQVARSIKQIGAIFSEEFRPTSSVLICRTLENTRKEKLKCALSWAVPIVSAEWLWECIATGCKVPLEDFTFSQLKKRFPSEGKNLGRSQGTSRAAPTQPPTAPAAPKAENLARAGVDHSGFDEEAAPRPRQHQKLSRKIDSTTSADFQTALTHAKPQPSDTDSPLTELSSASLNKSPSPSKSLRMKSDPMPAANPLSPTRSVTRLPSAPEPQATTTNLLDEEQEAELAERKLLNTNLANLIDATAAATSPSPASFTTADEATAPRPRRSRKILGRATSNVSATSSNAASAPARQTTAEADDEGQYMGAAAAGGAAANEDDEGEDGREHPATQLAYGDPKAQDVKKQLMSKMMGDEPPDHTAATPSGVAAAVGGGRSLRKR